MKELKDRAILVKVSKRERDLIQEKAEVLGMSVCAYIRFICLSIDTKSIKDKINSL